MIIELTIILSTSTAQVTASNDIAVTVVLNDEVVNPEESFCERVDECLGISDIGDEDLLLNQKGEWVAGAGWAGVWGSIIGTITNQTDLVSYITTRLTGYATQAWVTSQGYITNVITALGYTPENLSNKQTDLTASSTKYPTVDAVNTGLGGKENAIPAGTISQYWRGDKTFVNFPTIPTITPAALTKTDDTNVTLTLGGTPSTSLLQDVSLNLGWTGTLADSRIASAATWNAKQNALTNPVTGTGTANELSYFTGTSTIGSLTTATYPSLTELSYLKGITSGIVGLTDYSATSTIIGWSSFTTKLIYYSKIGNLVFVQILITGVSNSTSTSFTLPFPLNSSQGAQGVIWGVDNSSTGLASRVRISTASPSTAVIDYQWTSAWTASGTKVCNGSFFYSA